MIAAYQQMLTSGRRRGRRKDGSVFDQQMVMIKAYDQQQQFIGHYCFIKDISDRREIERLKDEFVSVVSHELRTPLTSIAVPSVFGSGLQPPNRKRVNACWLAVTDRLVRLINDILDIDIESGKVSMVKQTCDAANLILQSADAMRAMADKAGVTLSVSPYQPGCGSTQTGLFKPSLTCSATPNFQARGLRSG